MFQDYDNADGDVNTLGWVNTWDYAQQAPSTWGKGVWSIPRKLTLYCDEDSVLRLRQWPVKALEVLREKPVKIRRTLRRGVEPLKAVSAMSNRYELDVRLTPSDGSRDVAGLNLCCGEGRKVAVSYDFASGYLIVDRTNSTDADIPKFDRIAYAKVGKSGRPVDLKIL